MESMRIDVDEAARWQQKATHTTSPHPNRTSTLSEEGTRGEEQIGSEKHVKGSKKNLKNYDWMQGFPCTFLACRIFFPPSFPWPLIKPIHIVIKCDLPPSIPFLHRVVVHNNIIHIVSTL